MPAIAQFLHVALTYVYILLAPAPDSFFQALDVERSELCICEFGLETLTFHQQFYSELFFNMDVFSLYDTPRDLPFETSFEKLIYILQQESCDFLPGQGIFVSIRYL